jgi:branched-chain amino acid transport system permease protein
MRAAIEHDAAWRWSTAILLAALLILTAAAASFAAPALQRTVTEALIKLIVVIGMYIFVGNSGVLSFGHVSFMAIGGYLSAILTIPPDKKQVLLDLPSALAGLQLPGVGSALLAAGFAGAVALVVGIPLMRLKGIALPMATFALLAITHVVALNWKAVTGGRQALVGLPRFTTLWVALAAALVTLFAAAAYQQTRRGLLLRCSRENEVAGAATGIDVPRERLIAFALSATFVGLGGVLFAHFLGTMTANTLYLDITFVTLTMLVVGGMRSLTGACAGTALVSVVAELFRTIEKGIAVGGLQVSAPPGLQEIALSLVLLAVLIFRPDGLVGDRELSWPRRFGFATGAGSGPGKN